jgi:hypothetical protein
MQILGERVFARAYALSRRIGKDGNGLVGEFGRYRSTNK